MHRAPYPDEYVQYLAEYFGSRDYFECHEIMEEYWKEHPDSKRSGAWLVLIRIAVALYHARRGNRAGAVKLMGKAAHEADEAQFNQLGIDGAKLKSMLQASVAEWAASDTITYTDLDLPIVDDTLLELAKHRSDACGYTWRIGGLDAGDAVINRHKLRDRSDVIAARAASVQRKALERKQP